MTFDEMVASITPPPEQPDLSGTYTKPSGLVLTVTLTQDYVDERAPQSSPRLYRVQGRVGGRLVRAGLYRHDALASMLRNATKAETKDQA
jgi:hypothetical protein